MTIIIVMNKNVTQTIGENFSTDNQKVLHKHYVEH